MQSGFRRLIPDGQIERAKITIHSRMDLALQEVRRCLSPEQFKMLEAQTWLSKYFPLEHFEWSGQVVHNLIMRMVGEPNQVGESMFFEVGGQIAEFGIKEFGLITGLKCVGNSAIPDVVNNRLYARYFPTFYNSPIAKGQGVPREEVLKVLFSRKFDSDEDSVKLASLYILYSTFLVKAKSVRLLPKYISLANDMAVFNAYPWGRLSYEMTRDSINNIVISRHRVKPTGNHYTLVGCPQILQVWAYECIPELTSKDMIKSYDKGKIPRILAWVAMKSVTFVAVSDIFKGTIKKVKRPHLFYIVSKYFDSSSIVFLHNLFVFDIM